jgi:hypothetical protein
MSEDIKIEKNIPIYNNSRKQKFDELISQMEVGDSVLLTSYTDIEQIRQPITKKLILVLLLKEFLVNSMVESQSKKPLVIY